MDMGSAVMTTEMVIETFEGKKVEMVDCPLVEGAVVATIDSVGGMDFEAIKTALAGHPGSSEAGGFIPGSQEGCIVCYKTASFADDPGVTRTAGQSSFSLP